MRNEFSELSVELTNRCSLNCLYCSSSASIEENLHLDFQRIKEIILQVRDKFGIDSISLSGGETFLYEYITELTDFLIKKRLRVLIYTSGVVIDSRGSRVSISREHFNKLQSRGNIEVHMNIQGHNRELTESINGVPGSFDVIEETIENARSEGVYLGAHTVPFSLNFRYLEDIYQYCQERYFNEMSFLRFVPQGRGRNPNFYNTRSEFTEINHSLSRILRRSKNEDNGMKIRLGHPINFLFISGDEKLYDEETTHYCRGGFDAPLILPNGDVVICPAWKGIPGLRAGNIFEEEFEEIWNSDIFITVRKFVLGDYANIGEPCGSCEHLDDCRGKCVAQRLLHHGTSRDRLDHTILCGPDPQCFQFDLDGD